MRIMSGGSAPAAPTSAPPKSLLEAAVGRPNTQRGLDPQPPQGGRTNGSGHGNGSNNNQHSSGSTSRRYEYDPEGDDDAVNATAIDINPHATGRGHYQQGATGLSLDELV